MIMTNSCDMIITNCCDMIVTNSCDMIMTNGILLPSKVGWLARFKDIKVSGSYLAGDQGGQYLDTSESEAT